jgi:predicted RNase H-like nuclease
VTTLVIGFDSAWTPGNTGGIVAALRTPDGEIQSLGEPEVVNYAQAAERVDKWQREHRPAATLIMLDQPTIVRNEKGQRPVEAVVSSPVSRRRGGVQPANTGREEMFGQSAPLWSFLQQFGGAADPLALTGSTWVFETYPVLAMIAMDWVLPDSRPAGCLPKYNPQRRKTFRLVDWAYVCGATADRLENVAATELAPLVSKYGERDTPPSKGLQDRLDACICLAVGLELAAGGEGLLVGNVDTGYMVVPYSSSLETELTERCQNLGRPPGDWVRRFRLPV